MFTVFDVRVSLSGKVEIGSAVSLKNQLAAAAIEVVGLGPERSSPNHYEMVFAAYGNIGPFMMKKIINDCICEQLSYSSVTFVQRQ